MELSVAVVRHPLTDVVITGGIQCGEVYVSGVTVGKHAGEVLTSLTRDGARNQDELAGVVDKVAGFLSGEHTDLSQLPVAINDRTAFQKKVLTAARRIPYGTTCSYAELAKRAESPMAVRAVASVMRRNPVALLIPCHRIIRSDGTIGGYCGSLTGEDVLLKQRLLAMEAPAAYSLQGKPSFNRQ